SDPENIVHLLVWGTPFLGDGLPTMEVLRQVTASNGIAVLAHPSRREAWKRFDPRWVEHLLGMEVWNRKADGWAPSVTAESLISGTSLVGFVGVDFHGWKQTFPLSMELKLDSTVTERAVLNCLLSRRCQAIALSTPIDKALRGWRRAGLRGAEEFRRR